MFAFDVLHIVICKPMSLCIELSLAYWQYLSKSVVGWDMELYPHVRPDPTGIKTVL